MDYELRIIVEKVSVSWLSTLIIIDIYQLAQSVQSNSACSNTVEVAFSHLSGG
jgi:hypothetical protein